LISRGFLLSRFNGNFNQKGVKSDLWKKIVNLHIEKLPEGFYLATSDNIQGLIAQGRTIAETLEIARDVAKKLLEAQAEEQTNNLAVGELPFDFVCSQRG